VAPGSLTESVTESERVLVENEDLQYFTRRGDLVKPIMDAQDVPGLKRDRVSVVIQPVTPLTVQRDLAKKSKFKTIGRGGWRHVDPPERLAAHLLDRAAAQEGRYRALDVVTTCPTLLPDGRVLNRPGYEQGIYFLLRSERFAPVPESPSRDEAVAALAK